MKKILVSLLVIFLMISMSSVFAKTDSNNGDWSKQNITLKNTSEAELMVRVGDIDALNGVLKTRNPSPAAPENKPPDHAR